MQGYRIYAFVTLKLHRASGTLLGGQMTFTGAIGAAAMLPLRAIINASVALGIHPNVLTLIGVLINVLAAFYLATDHFITTPAVTK